MTLPDTPPMSIPPSPPTPPVLDLSGLFCCTTKFGHLPEGVTVSQVLEEAVEDEIVEFGILLQSHLPLRSGERKVVKRSMNRTLFTTFCVKQLNRYCDEKIQPIPTYRPKSPRHIWNFTTKDSLTGLFDEWKLDPHPVCRPGKRNDDNELMSISLLLASEQEPVQFRFSETTGTLLIEFSWQVINLEGIPINVKCN